MPDTMFKLSAIQDEDRNNLTRTALALSERSIDLMDIHCPHNPEEVNRSDRKLENLRVCSEPPTLLAEAPALTISFISKH